MTVRIGPSPDMYRGPTHLQEDNGWVSEMFSMDFACFFVTWTHPFTDGEWVGTCGSRGCWNRMLQINLCPQNACFLESIPTHLHGRNGGVGEIGSVHFA